MSLAYSHLELTSRNGMVFPGTEAVCFYSCAPLTLSPPKILLVIPLTVYHTLLITLVQRIWFRIN